MMKNKYGSMSVHGFMNNLNVYYFCCEKSGSLVNFYCFADVTRDEVMKTEYEEQLKVFNVTDLIWNLCEILWIDSAPGTQ